MDFSWLSYFVEQLCHIYCIRFVVFLAQAALRAPPKAFSYLGPSEVGEKQCMEIGEERKIERYSRD